MTIRSKYKSKKKSWWGKTTEYLGKLVESNSGVSSKAFFLVAVTIIGCVLLIITGFVLVWEVMHNGTIQTDLTGLAAFVGSISSLFVSAGITKAWGDKADAKRDNHSRVDFNE